MSIVISNSKQLSAEKVIAKICERAKIQRANYDRWKKVEKILAAFEGKAITKRIATAVQKEFSDCSVFYDTNYNMFHLRFAGEDISSYFVILIGYSTDPFINMEIIKNANVCYELELSRSEKLESLTGEIIKKNIKDWNEGLLLMQSAYKWASDFEIEYFIFDNGD